MDAVTEHAVVIAGGGPTGLMLAAELTLAGTDVVDRRAPRDQALDGSRAGGLHARTIEVLDQRGVADRFVAAGQPHPFVGLRRDPSWTSADFPTRHPYLLALWQGDIERILADWVLGELGVPILRCREVVGLAQDDAGVDVEVSDGSTAASAPTSSAATAGAARSARRRASTSPGWTPRPAG